MNLDKLRNGKHRLSLCVYGELTFAEENELKNVIDTLQPHKALLEDIKPKFYVIRKGWGSFKERVKRCT